jgi:hypothetical protein
MAGRVGVDVAVQVRRAELDDVRAGGGRVLDHDVEVYLLRTGGSGQVGARCSGARGNASPEVPSSAATTTNWSLS